MSKKTKQFVNALRAKKGIKHMALGGPVGANMQPGGFAGNIAGLFTPQNQYVAQLAPTTPYEYSPTVNGAISQSLSGYGTSQNTIQNEQALASRLDQQSLGQGPNPAQAALANNTGANVAQQAALAAGQRGASANVGLMARQVGQQGAQIQQNSVGQAAVLQAQQQLAAQQQEAALHGQIANQNVAEQGVNNSLAGLGMAADSAQNNNIVANYQQAQYANAAIAAANAQADQKTFGGFLSGLGSIAASVGQSVFKPGQKNGPTNPGDPTGASGPISDAGQTLAGGEDQLPTISDPGSAPTGGDPFHLNLAKGAVVPGKPKVRGDDLKNDTVPAMLSPGEIVLPRSVTQHPNAAMQAAKFVQAIQAKQGMKRKK